MDRLKAILRHFVEQKYEGVVIRDFAGLYEYSINGRRSKHVLRYKPRFDLDVAIEGFCSGIGKDSNAIIWHCRHAGKQFNSVQNTTLQNRVDQFRALTDNAELFAKIRKTPLLIEYNEASESQVPLQSRAIMLRIDKSQAQFS